MAYRFTQIVGEVKEQIEVNTLQELLMVYDSFQVSEKHNRNVCDSFKIVKDYVEEGK